MSDVRCCFLTKKGTQCSRLSKVEFKEKLYCKSHAKIQERLDTRPECCVCMEPINKTTEIPCNHIFCTTCLNKWLKKQNSCPICRAKVVAEVMPGRDAVDRELILGYFRDLLRRDIDPIGFQYSFPIMIQHSLETVFPHLPSVKCELLIETAHTPDMTPNEFYGIMEMLL